MRVPAVTHSMLVETVHTAVFTLLYQQVDVDHVLAGTRFWTVDTVY